LFFWGGGGGLQSLPIEKKLDDIMSHYQLPYAATGAPTVYEEDPRTPLDIRQQAPGSKASDEVPFRTLLKEWVAGVFLYPLQEEERRYKELRDMVSQREGSPPVSWHKLTGGLLKDYFFGTDADKRRINQAQMEQDKKIKALEASDDLGIGLMTLPDEVYRSEEVVHPTRLKKVQESAWSMSRRWTEATRSPLTRRKALLEMDDKVQRRLSSQPPKIPVEVLTEEHVKQVKIDRQLAGIPSLVPQTREDEIAWTNREYDSWFDRKPGATPPKDDAWWNTKAYTPKPHSQYSNPFAKR